MELSCRTNIAAGDLEQKIARLDTSLLCRRRTLNMHHLGRATALDPLFNDLVVFANDFDLVLDELGIANLDPQTRPLPMRVPAFTIAMPIESRLETRHLALDHRLDARPQAVELMADMNLEVFRPRADARAVPSAARMGGATEDAVAFVCVRPPTSGKSETTRQNASTEE